MHPPGQPTQTVLVDKCVHLQSSSHLTTNLDLLEKMLNETKLLATTSTLMVNLFNF